MLTRRRVLQGLGGLVLGGLSFTSYAIGIEPFRVTTTRYRLTPPGWPRHLPLRIAVLTDLHACEPWMTAEHVRHIAKVTNGLAPDITLLLGDYTAKHKWVRGEVPRKAWAAALGELKAPLGVHAILGNHDWWDDPELQHRRRGPTRAGQALEEAGIPVYENVARRLAWRDQSFWLGGLGDQWAFYLNRRRRRRQDRWGYEGVDDLPGLLKQVPDEAPLLLMAHEPDVFPRVPSRVALTMCGHTHGGQVSLLGYMPVIPSRYGRRYAYGHVVEDDRHLIISAGLGMSGMPVRFGRPPEIVVIELGEERASS